jgi:hypothetical protein
MKKNPIGALLVAGLFLCSLLSAVLAVSYLVTVQESERHRSDLLRINNTMNLVKAFANETLLYGQTNSAIDPILMQYGLKRVPATNSPGTTNLVQTTR